MKAIIYNKITNEILKKYTNVKIGTDWIVGDEGSIEGINLDNVGIKAIDDSVNLDNINNITEITPEQESEIPIIDLTKITNTEIKKALKLILEKDKYNYTE